MFPLQAVLIGDDERVLPHVRRELANNGARLEAEFRSVAAAVDGLRVRRLEKRLFVLHLRASRDAEELRRLSGTFVGQPVLALAGGDDVDNLAAVLLGAM